MFQRGSRYESVPQAVHVDGDGREIPYLRLRRIPPAGTPMAHHKVGRTDRLDRIATLYYQDPEQLWRIADANDALAPEELTAEPGRRLVVPLPPR